MKYLAIILLLASCKVSQPTLSTTGRALVVQGDRVFVVFPDQQGNDTGAAWFDLPGCREGDELKLVKP